jgi:hypothetical protein
LPGAGVPRHQGDLTDHLRGHYSSFIAHTGSCASPISSFLFRVLLNKEGLCRLLPASAGGGTFPTLSLQSLCRRLDPYPAVLLGCSYPFLPQGHRPHVTGNTFGARKYPCHSDFGREPIFGAAVIRSSSISHTHLAPRSLPPQRTSYAERLGLLHHASPERLPYSGCGIAT